MQWCELSQLAFRQLTGLAVLGLYEILLTLEDGLAILWRHKITTTSIIFFLNRATLVCIALFSLLPSELNPKPMTVGLVIQKRGFEPDSVCLPEVSICQTAFILLEKFEEFHLQL